MGEDLKDKLRRLRREPQAPPDLQSAPQLERAGLPEWLRGRFARDCPLVERGRTRSIGDPANLIVLDGPSGAFAARDSLHSLDARHGRYALREAFALEP